jgi:hypothetical protein
MRLPNFTIFAELVIRHMGKCINDAKISVLGLIMLCKSIQLGSYQLQPAGFYHYFCMMIIKKTGESPSFKIPMGLGNLDIDMPVYDPFVPWIRIPAGFFTTAGCIEETLAEPNHMVFLEDYYVFLRIFVNIIKSFMASPVILLDSKNFICEGDGNIYLRNEKRSGHVQ